MPSKPVGGFDLELGALYNQGWYNAATPSHNGPSCIKCRKPVTIHYLEKYVFAFGNITIKYCTVRCCPNCLHEVVYFQETAEKRKKATRANLTRIFSKLPKPVQIALLKGQS